MTVSPRDPHILPSDRLGLTLFFAVVIHAVVILGVTFKPDLLTAPQNKHPPLEITLVHQRSEEAPEEAELLAQANLEGGGSEEADKRPQSPTFTPVSPQRPGTSTTVTMPASPTERAEPEQTEPLTRDRSDQQTRPEEPRPEKRRQPLTAEELMARSMEIATLSAEISQSLEAYSKRPKHRYISARAREYRFAAYLDAWRAKIERIGNLNYPEEAKRRSITGSLRLDVAVNPDGSVREVTVLQPSGHKLLDDAARRIVHLAAPFSPFPQELREDTDVLHIIRTWEFMDNDRLSASR